MSDWKANKGAGPWPFIKQEEKCGYVNNPRWTATPASEVVHEPCGYWPKGHPGIAANIYGVLSSGGFGSLWGCYFDGEGLSFSGHYDSPDLNIHGIDFYNGNLLTVAGSGANAVLREVRSASPFDKIADHTSFNANDWPQTDASGSFFYANAPKKYFLAGASTDGRLIRLSSSLVKEARGCYCTVVTGTDGHLYLNTGGLAPAWRADSRPITGAFYTIYWRRIQDDAIDSPITAWGAGANAIPAYSAAPKMVYDDGFLYMATSQSVNYFAIRKIDASSLAIVASLGLLFTNQVLVNNGVLYILVGATTCTVHAYKTSDLSLITKSGVLPHGKAVNGDMAVVDGELVVQTEPNTSDYSVYRLDLTTLAIKQETVLAWPSLTYLYQRLAVINKNFLAVGENDGCSVMKMGDLLLPQYATRVNHESGSPPFVDFLSHSYGNFSQERVIVGTGVGGGSVGDRCGTPPYWPMPPS